MDALRELIQNETERTLRNSSCIFSLPVRVIEDLDDELYIVETIGTRMKYTVHNYSGSSVEIGEDVLLYFKGGTITNQSAYIGASLNKDSGGGGGGGGSDTRHAKIIYIDGDSSLKELSNDEAQICEVNFKALEETTVSLVFNTSIDSDTVGTATFKIYVDEELVTYAPKDTVCNGYTHCTFNLPIPVEEVGEHTIVITATGIGYTEQSKGFIHGQSIEPLDEYMTDENDYIYQVFSDHSETWFYIGTKKRIIMPTTLEGQPVTVVHATTFTETDVTSVRIPEGIHTIE